MISTELYTGHVFQAYELVPTGDRHHGTRLQLRAIGVQFNWTLNQKIAFSAALAGKPLRNSTFRNIAGRCVIGTKSDFSQALNKVEWCEALKHGDLSSLQQGDGKDPMGRTIQSTSMSLLTWKPFGDTFRQLSAITTCHSTKNGKHQSMED